MSWINPWIPDCKIRAEDWYEIIAGSERWDAIAGSDERVIRDDLDFEPDIVRSIVDEQQRQVRERQLTVDHRDFTIAAAEHDHTDDDIAMVVRCGALVAERSPVVSFWAMATLMSMKDRAFNEAKNYWLSAILAVMHVFRQRTTDVRSAFVSGLASSVDADIAETPLVALPIAEMILESPAVANNCNKEPAYLAMSARQYLDSVLKYAVESDARSLCNSAFPKVLEAPGDDSRIRI